MRYRILLSYVGVVLAMSCLSGRVCAEADVMKPPVAQSSAARAASYPETPEGLKNLLGDVIRAERAEDVRLCAEFYAALAIPNHAQWFGKTFGEAEGARLKAKYASSSDGYSENLKKNLQGSVQTGRTVVKVRAAQKAEDSSVPWLKTTLMALATPTAIYSATGTQGTEDSSSYHLGDFVYVEGWFRYLDPQVMLALSTARPMRIRIGGAVLAAKLVKEVQPVYPNEAKADHIQGTVKLHVIVGQDGSVQQVSLVSGHPALVKAAIEAVKQWQYKQTTLNGQPVEVDTEVDVNFSLKN